jgi:hypothetical protein
VHRSRAAVHDIAAGELENNGWTVPGGDSPGRRRQGLEQVLSGALLSETASTRADFSNADLQDTDLRLTRI